MHQIKIYINAPEGCQHGTHTNGTHYIVREPHTNYTNIGSLAATAQPCAHPARPTHPPPPPAHSAHTRIWHSRLGSMSTRHARKAAALLEEEYSVMGAGATGPAGRRGAEGWGGRAARRVPARAGRAAAAASDLREGGRRASRAVAGAGWGEATNLNLGGGGERGQVERTDRPSRGDADEEGGVGHGGAGAGASRHQEAGGQARAREAPPGRQLTAPLRLRSDLREASLADEVGGDLATHKRAMSRRRPSPPPPPAASARARAGGPRHLRAARCRRPTS